MPNTGKNAEGSREKVCGSPEFVNKEVSGATRTGGGRGEKACGSPEFVNRDSGAANKCPKLEEQKKDGCSGEKACINSLVVKKANRR